LNLFFWMSAAGGGGHDLDVFGSSNQSSAQLSLQNTLPDSSKSMPQF
jgi:hypothetical protein